ncbi:MAG: DUF2723 domain-containing protein [Muribaculaceae bacterium]|nr:DUF2723 domain-containing protein [Muribaculaceae bacterium]
MSKISQSLHRTGVAYHVGTIAAFLLAIVVYFLTVDPSASFWDCPEYILTAYRLEIGHSPGNPTWMLFHNIVSRIAGALFGVEYVALSINLCSGLFMALGVAILFQISFFTIRYAFRGMWQAGNLPAAIASLCGALIFAWSDSPWFSAVEAEVYAMSLFFTAMSMRLMIAWARSNDPMRGARLLILSAYVLGLSIGVHELNLLVIPALALIFAFRRYKTHACLRGWGALALSVGIIAIILLGMYPGTSMMAGELEVFFVNGLGGQFMDGVFVYFQIMLAVAFLAPYSISRGNPRSLWRLFLRFILVFLLIFFGGFFLFERHFVLSIFLSSAAAMALAVIGRKFPFRVSTILWMASLCLVGFSSYLLIPIRGVANPPVNENAPDDVFSFYSYLKRDQYGKKPLFYGPTPYAKPLYQETIDSSGNAVYEHVVRIPRRPVYKRAMSGAHLSRRSGLLTKTDSLDNEYAINRIRRGESAYVLVDYRYDLVYTPELNMFFPRLTSHNDVDISNYASWASMTPERMTTVEGSFALDSLGNPVGRLFSDGKRTREKLLRPTYLQHLQELFGYQIGYMYFRYLLWNFAGRQNDYPAAGEIEHGNFITGIPLIDNLMLGPQDELPEEIGRDNIGKNPYFMLPLALGIAGIVVLCSGRRRKRANAVITVLFLMTGVAIVVYLNQDPGEPRERDYSFIGSFFAFSIWIACGASWLLATCRNIGLRLRQRFAERGAMALRYALGCGVAITFAIPAWMLAVNYADHDRSYRSGPDDYATNLLESLDRDAILFLDGDNYTFPVWYAQEVLGVRRDVRVVNMAYLTTPWYVVRQLVSGEESQPLKMQATEGDIAYEAFTMTRLPSVPTDSIYSGDAVSELRKLYSSNYFRQSPYWSRDPFPRLSSSWLRIASGDNDSIYVNLHKALNGSSMISLRELALLDIVATNASQLKPRPVYFQNALTDRQLVGLAPYTSRTLYARKLDYSKPPSDTASYLIDEGLRFLPKIRTGGADHPRMYADPYVGMQISQQRMALLRLGDALLRNRDTKNALKVAKMTERMFPQKVWPYQAIVAKDGEIWQEGLKLSEIMIHAASAEGDTATLRRGRVLERSEKQRLASWHKWYKSLSDWRRSTVSRESRRLHP